MSEINLVNPQEFQNIRLVVDVGNKTIEIPLGGNLILKNIGPEASTGGSNAAFGGNAAAREQPAEAQQNADKEDKKEEGFLIEMRGWLITVATLFVSMAFQAALQPPAWMRTTDFLRAPRRLPAKKHAAGNPFVAAARAAAPAPMFAAPAATLTGESWRAQAYIILNALTFATALALVMLLVQIPSKAKFIVYIIRVVMWTIYFFVATTFVLGSSDDWRYNIIIGCIIMGTIYGVICYVVFPNALRRRRQARSADKIEIRSA